MELKLNIYEKKQVIKTYTAETYDLMFATVEDLIETLNLDQIEINNDMDLIKVVSKVVVNGLDFVKPLLKDIFEGLTDEEIRNAKISEIASTLVDVVKFAMHQIGMGKGDNSKN